MIYMRHGIAALAAFAYLYGTSVLNAAPDYLVYIGTYTGDKSKGIYAYRFDSKTGQLTPLGLAGEITNPSFLTIHPNSRFLYAVSETSMFEGQKTGAVSSFAINPETGMLTFLNRVASKGTSPCHLNVDKTGKFLAVANYGNGTVSSLPIGADGKLGEAVASIQHSGSSTNPTRQKGPHAHSVNFSHDNRFLVAADLGIDQVLVYKFDPGSGSLTANEPPFIKVAPGSGPRHFAFHPARNYGYVINELSSTVTAMSYDKQRGAFTELQTISTLPGGTPVPGNSTAEVQVHPSGKFVYGSNRGHDSIAVFAVDVSKGTLKVEDHTPTQGQVPRNFGIDPTGSFLIAANQKSDNLVVFRIDKQTGRLTPAGQKLEVGAPVCVKFLKTK